MTHMLCRNKVIDFAKWKRGLDSHADAHNEAGLTLKHLWQNVNDPNEVFFFFAVADIKKAQAFINAPESAKAGKDFGVIDGAYWFVK